MSEPVAQDGPSPPASLATAQMVEDLGIVDGASDSLAKPSPVDDLGIPADIEHRSQLGMRETITVWMVGLLCAIIALAFIALFMDDDVALFEKRYESLKGILDVIMGPVVTLLSSVIGFYFGSQVAQQRRAPDDKP